MTKSRASVGIVLAIGVASSAASQPLPEQVQSLGQLVGTMDVQSQPSIAKGKLQGCQLVFDAIIQDYAYHDGAFMKVSGSASIMSSGGKMGTTVKVVAEVLDPTSVDAKLVPSAPSRAYLVGKNYTNNLSGLVNAASTSPGAWFAIYNFQPTVTILKDAIAAQTLTFAFNQNGGSTDIQLPIDLTVARTDDNGKRTHSTAALEEYSKCIGVLGDQFK
jgi:hypothetical protein